MSKDNKGNTVSVSSSNNISMYIFNGIEEDCTYEKYEKRIKCGLEYKEIEHVIEKEFKLPTEKDLAQDPDLKKKVEDDKKARVMFKMTTEDEPNDLIEELKTAKEMKEVLDSEYKLGDKEYDLEYLENQYDECVLVGKQNPTLFFTKLSTINKKFAKFKLKNGKDYQRDSRELMIKIKKSIGEEEYSVVLTAFSVQNKTVHQETKLKDLKEAIKEHWKENYSELYNSEDKSGKIVMNTETGKMKCGHCGKPYHTADQCWEKHPHLKATAMKKKFNKKNIGGKDKSGFKCWKCGGDHMKRDCPLKNNGGNNSDLKKDGDDVNGLFMGMTLCQEIKKNDEEIKYEMGIFLGEEEELSVNVASEKRNSNGNEYWLADKGSQIHVAKELRKI